MVESGQERLTPEQAKIVIIDDDENITVLLERILKKKGYVNASFYNDPTKCLEEIQKSELFPDLVISDVNMPGMDGPQLLRSIKALAEERSKPVPGFVIMSALPDQITPEIREELHLEAVVKKPFPDIFAVPDTVIKTALESHWNK